MSAKPKPLPRAVTICSTKYKVVRQAGIIDGDGDYCAGTCEPLKGCITIEKKLAEDVAWATFEHEVAHGSFEESGAGYILAKFIDNPDHAAEAEELLVRTWIPAYTAAIRSVKR